MSEALQPIALGLLLLVFAFFIQRRTWRARAQRGKIDPLQQAQTELHQLENHQRNEVNRLETRLHDFERSVDGKIETRVTQLEQLLIQADQEIERLTQALNNSGKESVSRKETGLTSRQAAMIRHLAESGYSPVEISGLTEISETTIASCLSVPPEISAHDDQAA